jgi:hypothetical protein
MAEVRPSKGPNWQRVVHVTAFAILLATPVLGCATQADQRRRLMDQAQDLNVASRFGRLDVASQFAAPEAQPTFMQRRRSWGREIQILDTQLSHSQVKDENHAEVIVQVDWTRANEGLLRTTWVKQEWNAGDRGAWKLEGEQQIDGDKGLFGEQSPAQWLAPAGDRHFQTRSLGVIDE